MANFGRLTFRNSRASGQTISQLGSGQYSHLGFFGPGGHLSAVEIGSYQDTTIVVDSTGTPASTVFGGTSYLTNCKFITSTTVRVSGVPRGPWTKPISQVNKFLVGNLAAGMAPNFLHRNSGTLLIQYTSSGTSKVNTFNAKIYAYDEDLTIADAPNDVTVVGFEINASGTAWDASHSGQWHAMAGRDNALKFVDHSTANRWRSAHTHLWVAAISAKPLAVGVLDRFNFVFSMQFA